MFNRLFYRGIMGGGKKADPKNFKVERKIITAGSSYSVSIPPVVIKDMGLLKTGVTLERKGDTLIIKGRGNNAKK